MGEPAVRRAPCLRDGLPVCGSHGGGAGPRGSGEVFAGIGEGMMGGLGEGCSNAGAPLDDCAEDVEKEGFGRISDRHFMLCML